MSGTKAIHQTVLSDNPYVEIKYSEVIEIQQTKPAQNPNENV
jgi:hypothetical protein